MTPTPSPDPAAAAEGIERPGGWRKKPVEVEARQVHYANRFDVAAWCGGEAQDAAPSGNVYAPGLLSINTLEGKMWASEGDWIIRGVKGEFYPCKPDIFAATYEWVDEDPQPGCLKRIIAFIGLLFFIWLGWRITYLCFFAPGI